METEIMKIKMTPNELMRTKIFMSLIAVIAKTIAKIKQEEFRECINAVENEDGAIEGGRRKGANSRETTTNMVKRTSG